MRNSSLCWEIIQVEKVTEDPFEYAINDLVNAHDLDFKRIWLMMNRTSRKNNADTFSWQGSLQGQGPAHKHVI
jgi:hypothetical protein